jgi:hypothetical protein
MSLHRFCEITGLSKVSAWRYEKRGWLRTHLIANRRYILAADVAEFNRRLASDEFASSTASIRRALDDLAQLGAVQSELAKRGIESMKYHSAMTGNKEQTIRLFASLKGHRVKKPLCADIKGYRTQP